MGDGNEQSRSPQNLEALTGLRFLAAILVFTHHAFTNSYFFASDPRKDYGIQVPLGAIGVGFFFVLSGFIMTYVYRHRLTKSNTPKFIFTRFARIYPLQLVCTLAFISLFTGWEAVYSDLTLSLQALCSILLVQTWTFNEDWIMAYNGLSWSLSTEFFFYLAFPFLLLIPRRVFYVVAAVLAIVTFGIIYFISSSYGNDLPGWLGKSVHTFPPLRLVEFVSGMLVGHFFLDRKQDSRWLGKRVWLDTLMELASLAILVGIVVLYGYVSKEIRQGLGEGAFLYTRYSMFSFCFPPVIYIFSKSRGLCSHFFSSRLMIFLGNISFSFYLIHQMLFRALRQHIWTYEYLTHFTFRLVFAALLCICISTLLFLLVEIPCKEFLLRLYEKPEPKKSRFVSAIKSYFGTVKKETAWIPLCLAVLGIAITTFFVFVSTDLQMRRKWDVISKTEKELRNVEFGGQATLMGIKVEHAKNENAILLQFVWLPDAKARMPRHVVLRKPAGNIIGRAKTLKYQAFAPKKGELFTDRVRLPYSGTLGKQDIVVYFQKGRDRAEIINGEQLNAKHNQLRINVQKYLGKWRRNGTIAKRQK